MLHERLYLVLDQGSHASRAIVFNSTGHVISSDTRTIATQQPRKGRVEHDPEAVLDSLRQAMVTAVAGRKITVAGLTTQRSSIVCWSRKTGQALSPVISWRDVRAAAWMDSFSRYRDDIHALTGLFPSAHYGASKLHWCLAHLPEVKQALDGGELAWGPLASFLLFRMLDMFALLRRALPRCVANRYGFGHLHVSGQSIPMRMVMGDLPASLFASGWPQHDRAYVNAGTGAFVQRVTRKPPGHATGYLTGVAYQADGAVLYSLEGTVNGAGSALEWFAGKAGLQLEGHLEAWMERAEELPLFLNGISGLGSPLMSFAIGSKVVSLAKASYGNRRWPWSRASCFCYKSTWKEWWHQYQHRQPYTSVVVWPIFRGFASGWLIWRVFRWSGPSSPKQQRGAVPSCWH